MQFSDTIDTTEYLNLNSSVFSPIVSNDVKISNYLTELSSTFHSYYAKERVLDLGNQELTHARIYLINSIRIVIRNGLEVLGISSPNKM